MTRFSDDLSGNAESDLRIFARHQNITKNPDTIAGGSDLGWDPN